MRHGPALRDPDGRVGSTQRIGMANAASARHLVSANTVSLRGSHAHMTALRRTNPKSPARTGRIEPHADKHAAGDDVPIAVWRLKDSDHGTADGTAETRLGQRLARLLTCVYAEHGGTVVDFANDGELEQACAQSGRSYVPVTDLAAIADLVFADTPISLVTLRWPPQLASQPMDVLRLLTACRLIITAATAIVVSVDAAAPSQCGGTRTDGRTTVLGATSIAGYPLAQQIIAVSSQSGIDEFLFYADAAEVQTMRCGQSGRSFGAAGYAELLVFRCA
jgi:hypothetical protein